MSKYENIWNAEATYQAGVEAERNRIIKLLEDPATLSHWWSMPDKSLGLYGNLKNYVIALIKGENK